jgi:hypothetical protein
LLRLAPTTQSYFAEATANPLLLAALVDGERLAERLTQCALAGSISRSEQTARLHDLQAQLTALRYDEETSICKAISNGDDVARSGSCPAWAVLMVQIEHAVEKAGEATAGGPGAGYSRLLQTCAGFPLLPKGF